MKLKSAIFICLLLSSCGPRRDIAVTETVETTVTNPIVPGDNSDESCETVALSNGFAITCGNETYFAEGDQLAGAQSDANNIILIASKKNGGSGGSKWFNTFIDLDNPVNIDLPSEIPNTGDSGNGQKLYLLFNSEIDCVWQSHGGDKYHDPRCFVGGARNGATSSGFDGGVEVGNTEVINVSRIEMHVNGASGSGVMTTATATLEIQ